MEITTHGFTLQEVLVMAAMNVASALLATDIGDRTISQRRDHRDPLSTGVDHGKSN